MFAYTTWLLQWARILGQRFFFQFGLHCATHQIRVILISCVVITSLFYPALDLYVSSNNLSLSVLNAFASPNTLSGIPAQSDLVNLWSGHDTLRVHEDPFTRAKCREGSALRVERIFIQSPLVEDDGAVNHRILLSTLSLERRLENLLSIGDTPCLKRSNGRCFVISPLAFWGHDQDALRSDNNILDTLSYSRNISLAGIPITPQMVLAGRGSYEHHVAGNKFDYATFLALTYFFPQSACWGSSSERTLWVQTVQNAVAQNEVTVQVPEATVIALEYDPLRSESTANGWSAISAFLYLAYIGFFAYVAWSVRRMDAVHSRLGVTFTALVEIAVSTITSLSVCALVGFRITMVPLELLPIVIVFVGAENMFNLVDAVGKTSVTLSVKQRIAEGLSRAGTSNTLKVVSYNAILGIIAVFAVGAVRQFCIFAIVVLVAHWFLAHTFFMAVLSIDIARLELEELLRHDASLAPSVPSIPKDDVKHPRSGWQKLVFTTQNLLKGRAATNISLLMLLAIAATLYYTTYTASTSTPHPRLLKPLGAVSRSKGHLSSDVTSTAEQIWKTINPAQTSLLHLRIEMPTIITFNPNSADGISNASATSTMQSSYRSRYTMRTFRFVLWLLTIMVVPIAATTSVLWGFLLYLLKNTELLEAQRHRPEAAEEFTSNAQEDERGLEGHISFETLPRAFASDVELIAASKDGKVVVLVGLHNEVIIWNASTKQHVAIDAEDVLLGMASTSSCAASTIVCVTVDDSGHHFAVGTGAGLIAVWNMDPASGLVRGLPVLALEGSTAGVTEMRFVSQIPSFTMKKAPGRTPPTSEPSSPDKNAVAATAGAILLTTYESGVVARWSVSASPTVSFFSPSRRALVVRASLLHVIPDDRVLVAFCLDDGTLEVVETGDFEPTTLHDCCLQAGNAFDTVWKVHACRAEMNGSVRFVIAAATEAGAVSLWDGLTGECINVLEETHGRINHLRISPVQCETCHFCGHPPMESLSLAFSVDHVIRFSNLYLNDQTRRCSCTRNNHHIQQQPQHPLLRHVSSRESIGRTRSRSNSNASSSQRGSPLIPRARLATAFETSPFPVSGHGVHSRRASEKDTGRRSSELLTVPFPGSGTGEEYELNGANGYDYTYSEATTPTNAPQSIWRNAIVVRLVDVTCERGGWDVTSRKFVGIRRKPRLQGKSKAGLATSSSGISLAMASAPSPHGLTSATLERWELWTFDPALALLRGSLLAVLPSVSTLRDTKGSSLTSTSSSSSISSSSSGTSSDISINTSIPRLPFTRVSPLLISPSHALAGFGNTIGVFHFAS
ncbi:sterol regulatory element binding protein cleavage-activating protein [Crassisporium funariophilum]|nr:sterol regulatory element binding protein cleavage-activating protein [Crassisporium funariophilum]